MTKETMERDFRQLLDQGEDGGISKIKTIEYLDKYGFHSLILEDGKMFMASKRICDLLYSKFKNPIGEKVAYIWDPKIREWKLWPIY